MPPDSRADTGWITLRSSALRMQRKRIQSACIFAVTAGLAMREIQRQESRRERAVSGLLVARRIVGADAGRDTGDLGVVVRAEKERDRVARAGVAVDDPVRRRLEPV